MNKVILLGRLTKDPELRYGPGADAVAVTNFTVAVGRKKANDADFVDCVAFRGTAEFIAKYFKKGQMIAICGELRVERYTNSKGENKIAAKVIATDVDFAGTKKREEEGLNKEQIEPAMAEIEGDEDLPF